MGSNVSIFKCKFNLIVQYLTCQVKYLEYLYPARLRWWFYKLFVSIPLLETNSEISQNKIGNQKIFPGELVKE